MLLALARGADDLPRRVEMVRALTELVVLVRQHVRKFLPELTALVNEFWSGPGSGAAPAAAMVPHLLALLAELSREQRQQVASHPGASQWLPGTAAGRPREPVHPLLPPYDCAAPCCLPHPLGRAETLRDDFRAYMPDLLPQFVALFSESERTGDYSLVSAPHYRQPYKRPEPPSCCRPSASCT